MAATLGLGPAPTHLVEAPTTLGSGRAGLAAILAAHPQTDAVFCSSDMLALGVLIEVQTRGLAVPGQLGVVGFGDLELAASLQPALTTVRIDGTRIGRTAAQYIVDRAEGREVAEKIVDIGFEIIERASA
jgi:LacI family gluconate utilization system Gnt-I transcriptional repressor